MSNYGALSNLPDSRRTPADWLRLWFLLRDPVGRWEYAITGFGLMALKYVAEFLVVGQLTGLLYTPLDFINPLMSAREKLAAGAPDWFGMAWVVWSLPFLWIAAGMSVRRALDAGISPWHGLWVLVPFANLIAMPLLACLPPAQEAVANWDEERKRLEPRRPADVAATVKAAIGGIAIGALYASVVIQSTVYLFDDYGAALFFGTPFVSGIASGYLLNLRSSRSYLASIGVAAAALFFGGVALLLFAFEGLICIAMAVPIVLPFGIAGAPIGKFLADRRRRQHGGLVGALLFIPLFAVLETRLPHTSEFVVVSSIDVAAAPETVWRHVIGFSKITESPEWFFRMGISCPREARIHGTGVGATRECIFTTGTFVEPITAWDAPRRLAFDVREQPVPMFELTPYRHIHPPHLDTAFRSTRGEFELVELPDGDTRLVGRTWYTLDIRPHAYWTVWSDWLVQRIHQRVLRHVKRLAEERGSA
ncbi:MAG TPA: SRPBCC family protein [Lacipirellulaceae bacterium]